MGINLKIKGANFTNFIDRELPHAELVVGYFLFGGSEGESKKNLAPRALIPEATVVGSPSFYQGYAELTSNSFFDSGIVINTNTGDYTMITVSSVADTVRQPLCGTWHSGIQDAMLDRNPDLKLTTKGSGSGVAAIDNSILNDFVFSAGVKQGVNASVYMKTESGMQSEIGLAGTNVVLPNTYRIGPNGGLEIQNETQIQKHAANIICDQSMTSQQIQDVYEYLAFKLKKRNISMI